ncbi:MAG: thioesterase family protein [Actinobacteria bacterium]|nr:thioesterase family protein [Actinomycetota bacterium]
MSLEPGITAKVKAEVTPDMTALSQGSGAVEGLATPVMIRLMEAAAIKALEGQLMPGMTSVGTRVEVTHAAPTPVGMEVVAAATLVEVEGRLLIFSVSADDAGGQIGKGTHHRVIVDKDRFDDRIAARWTGPAEQ